MEQGSVLKSEYDAVILDAAIMAREFNETECQILQKAKVYVAETFAYEAEQFQQILDNDAGEAYRRNIRYLDKNVSLYTLPGTAIGPEGQQDVWGLLRWFVDKNQRILLISGNELLIQRVVIHQLRVDVYDFKSGQLLGFEQFGRLAEEYELEYQHTSGDMNLYRNGIDQSSHISVPGMNLYSAKGKRVLLGSEIRSGMEATLYEIADDNQVVCKVFKWGKLTQGKKEHIQRIQGINSLMGIEWAQFPQEVVYYDLGLTEIAGFLEKRVYAGEDLDQNPLYLGDVEGAYSEMGTTVLDTLKICLQVVRQVHFLNSFGFMISDYNQGNFAANPADPTSVQMWDTDSFSKDRYFSGYYSGDKMMKEYPINTKSGVLDFCNEAIYSFVFTLLSLGDTPLFDYNGKFKYDDPSYIPRDRSRLFPANMLKLFEAVYRRVKEPSVPVLLMELIKASRMLNETGVHTYGQLLGIRNDRGGFNVGKIPEWVPIAVIVCSVIVSVAALLFLLFI